MTVTGTGTAGVTRDTGSYVSRAGPGPLSRALTHDSRSRARLAALDSVTRDPVRRRPGVKVDSELEP